MEMKKERKKERKKEGKKEGRKERKKEGRKERKKEERNKERIIFSLSATNDVSVNLLCPFLRKYKILLKYKL
jgi:hypothetical protein